MKDDFLKTFFTHGLFIWSMGFLVGFGLSTILFILGAI